MNVINATEGLFAIGRGERDSLRHHLAQHGIQRDRFGFTGAGWLEANPGDVAQPKVDQLQLVHPEDIEKAIDLYRTWRTKHAPARSE